MLDSILIAINCNGVSDGSVLCSDRQVRSDISELFIPADEGVSFVGGGSGSNGSFAVLYGLRFANLLAVKILKDDSVEGLGLAQLRSILGGRTVLVGLIRSLSLQSEVRSGQT